MCYKSVVLTTPCWIWPTVRKSDGRAMSGRQYAYRVLYAAINGTPPPEGTIAHHLCENPACVNVLEHIEWITQGQHIAAHGLPGDWGNADKTECPAGHEYDDENTYIAPRGDRQCRECRRTKKRERRAANGPRGSKHG